MASVAQLPAFSSMEGELKKIPGLDHENGTCLRGAQEKCGENMGGDDGTDRGPSLSD
jgi:hypothetical protein